MATGNRVEIELVENKQHKRAETDSERVEAGNKSRELERQGLGSQASKPY